MRHAIQRYRGRGNKSGTGDGERLRRRTGCHLGGRQCSDRGYWVVGLSDTAAGATATARQGHERNKNKQGKQALPLALGNGHTDQAYAE